MAAVPSRLASVQSERAAAYLSAYGGHESACVGS